jgi:5-methylcytosine-specific restriction protein A
VKRQPFIESLGATCANWRWSWSFVNHASRSVIFGAWTEREIPEGQVILSDSWEVLRSRRTPAYKESLQHVRLVEEGYALFTFRMERELAYPGTNIQTSKIKAFDATIIQKKLLRLENLWVATDLLSELLPEQHPLHASKTYPEGSKKRIEVNAYERNSAARAVCLAKHGFSCAGCGIKLSQTYGEIANNFIHVHHLKQVSKLGVGYCVDPINDLIPVCPNCHAVIHLCDPMLSISELRDLLANPKESGQK